TKHAKPPHPKKSGGFVRSKTTTKSPNSPQSKLGAQGGRSIGYTAGSSAEQEHSSAMLKPNPGLSMAGRRLPHPPRLF
uniref:hypothetical protein n=2 Tax=Azorhizobium caulinodans TaxID=7 RepID=UPI002FBE9F93